MDPPRESLFLHLPLAQVIGCRSFHASVNGCVVRVLLILYLFYLLELIDVDFLKKLPAVAMYYRDWFSFVSSDLLSPLMLNFCSSTITVQEGTSECLSNRLALVDMFFYW